MRQQAVVVSAYQDQLLFSVITHSTIQLSLCANCECHALVREHGVLGLLRADSAVDSAILSFAGVIVYSILAQTPPGNNSSLGITPRWHATATNADPAPAGWQQARSLIMAVMCAAAATTVHGISNQSAGQQCGSSLVEAQQTEQGGRAI